MDIPYGRQCIDFDDIEAVAEVLAGPNLTAGAAVAAFEYSLAAAVGARYAVAVANGTAALHIAALACGLKPGEELITSPLTFAATANCALYCGAAPVFADIDPQTMLIDIESIRKKISPRTRIIIPVHYGGEICNMEALSALAEENGLTIIQDCAHSLGGLVHGKGQGEYCAAQTWSFHPVKTITTGEGGAVTTNSPEIYQILLRLRSHGITRDSSQFTHQDLEGYSPPYPTWYYQMVDLGFNYRLTDIQAALGLSQLSKLPKFALRRQEIVRRYDTAFALLPLDVQHSPEWSHPVRHLYTIRLHKSEMRKNVFDGLRAKGIGVNVHYIPVYLLPYYQNLGYKAGTCPAAEDAYSRLITLPLHPALSNQQVEFIIDAVSELVSKRG